MSLKKLLSRAKNRVGNAVEDVTDELNIARRYLEQHAPAITEAGSAALRTVERVSNPGMYAARHQDEPWNAPLKDITTIGVNLAGEPAAYGVNRLTGGDADSPWSDRNLDTLGKRGIAGRAAQFGIETAADPLSWIPTGKAPLAAQIGLGALGIGDFGGKSIPQKLARNLVGGAGMGAGAAAAAEVSDNPLLQLAGGTVGMGLGFTAAGHTPGLKNLTRDSRPAVRPQDVRDFGKTPEAITADRARQKADPLVKPVTRDEVSRLNQRIAEQVGLPLPARMGVVAETPPVTKRRMYHGTTVAFETPDAAKFDPDGLFGPGYYLTSDPRVAEGYAKTIDTGLSRQFTQASNDLDELNATIASLTNGPLSRSPHLSPLERSQMLDRHRAELPAAQQKYDALAAKMPSPNIRPINVPDNLRLFNVEESTSLSDADIEQFIRAIPDGERRTIFRNVISNSNSANHRQGVPTNQPGDVWTALMFAMDEPVEVNRTLAHAGYDGIRYDGGKRIPLKDDSGSDILHNVVVVFPESLSKIENALSLTPMGLGPKLPMREALGGFAGAGLGALQPADSDEQRIRNIESGAAAGVLGTAALTRGPGRTLLQKMAKSPMTQRAVVGSVGAGLGATEGDTWQERAANAARGAGYGLGMLEAGRIGRSVFMPGAPEYITRFDNLANGLARTEARKARVVAEPAYKVWEEAVNAGEITETPARQAFIAAKKAAANTPDDVAYIEANRMQPAAMREDPAGFVFNTPRAQAAKAQIDALYGAQEAGDVAASTLNTLVKDYQNRVYTDAVGSPSRLAKKPTSPQSHQLGRTYDTMFDAFADGKRMKSWDVPSLLEQRVQAGYTARAQKELLDTVKNMPGAISTTAQPGYRVALNHGFLQRVFPTFDTADLDTTLNDLASGLLTPSQAKAQVRANAGTGRMNLYLRDDVADALESYFNPQSKWTEGLSKLTAPVRELALGMDVALAGRFLPIAWIQATAGSNPGKASIAVTKALRDSFIPKYRNQMLNSDRYAFWSRFLSNMGPEDMGDVLSRPEGGTFLSRPFERAGEAVRARTGSGTLGSFAEGPVALEKWQFGAFLPALKFHVAEAVYRAHAKPNMAPAAADALAESIGRRVDTVTTGISRARAGTSRDHEEALRALVISPAYLRGGVGTVTDAFKGGIEGNMARWFLADTALTLVGLAAGVTAAMQWKDTGEVPSYNDFLALIDPREETAVTNPNGKNFLKIVTPEGKRIDLGGPMTPLVRSLMRPVYSGVGAANESLQDDKPLYVAVRDGLVGAFGWDKTESIRDWAESRQSIPLSLYQAISTNADFRDRAISNAADPNQRVTEQALYAGSNLLPGWTQMLLSDEKRALPQPTFDPMRGAAQFLGVGYANGPDDPKPIRDTVTAFLEGQGINPGVDPIATFKKAGRDIPKDIYQKFRADNPQVLDYVDNQAAEREANRQKPVGRAAADEYRNWQREARIARDAAIAKAGEAHAATADGDTYRRAVANAWTEYNGAMDNAAWVLFKTRNRDDVNGFMEKAYGKAEMSKEFINQAFDEYEGIRAVDETAEARDAMLEARRNYLAAGGVADQKYGAGTSTRLKSALRDRYREIGGETYAQYFDAQQIMGEYAQIPSHLVFDAAQGRRAQSIVSRAQDARRLGSPLPLAVLVLTDPRASEEDKVNALLIVRSGDRLRNPMKRMFYREHAREIGAFYSDVGWTMLDQLAS